MQERRTDSRRVDRQNAAIEKLRRKLNLDFFDMKAVARILRFGNMLLKGVLDFPLTQNMQRRVAVAKTYPGLSLNARP